MTELELKFQVSAIGRAGLLKALGNRRIERVELLAGWFDTEDHLLARHAMALRVRRENGHWVQTLKAAGPDPIERLEDNVELPDAVPGDPDAGATFPVDPARHGATPVGRRLLKLLKAHGRPPLIEVFRTEVTRRRRLLRAHDAVVEWALDEGSLVAGGRLQAISELELEFKDGDPKGLLALAREWQARHGLWLDTASKAQRGTLLAAGRACADPTKARVPRLDSRMDRDALLRAIVAACLAQILPNASAIAAGGAQPGHVHQLRIGLRRLRTALRELGDFVDGALPDIAHVVQSVFDALGEARDQHMLESGLAKQLLRAGAPLSSPPDPVAAGRAESALPALVRASPFQGALLQLLAFALARAHVPDGPATDAAAAVAPIAGFRQRLDRLHCQIVRDADGFEALEPMEQHRVRKRLKRLRYLAEFAAPLFKPRRVRAWLQACEPVQDALGLHVDHLVGVQRFERDAAIDPRAWFAVGWLRSRLPETARAGRKSLEKLARVEVFW